MATARIPMVKKLKTLPSGPTVPPVSHLAPCKDAFDRRSEEHTSELQSLTNLVCRLLLEKKKHKSELQSLTNIVCRLLLEKKKKATYNRKQYSAIHLGNEPNDVIRCKANMDSLGVHSACH